MKKKKEVERERSIDQQRGFLWQAGFLPLLLSRVLSLEDGQIERAIPLDLGAKRALGSENDGLRESDGKRK